MHACIHTHTCMHACMRCMHECIHTRLHTHTFMHPCMHTHTCTHACVLTSMHACIHTSMHACMHAWPLGALITARIERSSIFCHATVAAAVVRTGYSIQNRKAEQLSFPSRYAKPVGQPVWLNSWLLGAAKSQYTSLVYSVHNLCTEKSHPHNRH